MSHLEIECTVFEIILKNANDGTAAYDLMAGLFRIVCKNSLVSQTGTLDSLKVRHSGTPEGVQGKVIEGTYEVLRNAEAALAAPADWSGIQLDKDEKRLLPRPRMYCASTIRTAISPRQSTQHGF
ncbi:hypothetical protein FHT70_006168 [Rhizobium sp. BK049]|nr:hypothetical protein [Rhizobium sp. BK049]